MSESAVDIVTPTYIENWPAEVKALSMHQEGIPLSVQDAIALGKSQVELHEFWEDHDGPADLSNIQRALDAAVPRVSAQAKAPGTFIRLGSRSPKDSWWWWHAPERDLHSRPLWPVTSGEEAMRLLLETSERINDDLLFAVSTNYRPWIWVRAWEEILPFQEFRLFMHNRRIVGISQYDYMGRAYFPELVRDKSLYVQALLVFFRKRVLPVIHMDSAVLDMYVKVDSLPSGRGRRASARLLEINPYFSLTDPCLFTWEELEELQGLDGPPMLKIREEP